MLHPLLDDLSIHIHTNDQTGMLEALTETGRFHIALLRLNRPQLIKFRLSKQWLQMLHEKSNLLLFQVHEQQRTIAAQEQYIAALQAQIEQLHSNQ